MAAAALSNRAHFDRATSLFRQSFSFLRSLSSSPSGGAAASSTNPKRKKKKKKNLLEVAKFLPNWGIGYHMAKTHWSGVSYQITKLNLYKDGKHGKAWGLVHKHGLPAAEVPKKISGVHKRCWRYIPNLAGGITNATEDVASKTEAQAA